MKLKLISLIFLVFSFNATAEEKITTAFGLNIGDKFDINSSIGESSLTDGTLLYLFETNKKFRSFASHFVMLTPKTQRIYAIWGIGQVENTPSLLSHLILLQFRY